MSNVRIAVSTHPSTLGDLETLCETARARGLLAEDSVSMDNGGRLSVSQTVEPTP